MERAVAAPGLKGRRSFLLGTLTVGHAVMHWYQQSFAVILPEIKMGLELSDIQAGGLVAARQIAGGAINLPAGFLADRFNRQLSLILATAMAGIGIGYLFVGVAPSYVLILPAMILVGLGPAAWHPPAISALSQRFPDRRGLALAFHGVGGSVGDTLAPLAVGALLVILSWQHLLRISTLPAVLLALVVWSVLRGMHGQQGTQSTLRAYLGSVRGLIHNRTLVILMAVSGLRSMGQIATITFLPIYLREDLEYSTIRVGLLVSLLTLMGMGSQPVMGFLSDRLGRKAVLLPGLLVLSLLYMALALAAPGVQLILVIAALGLLFYSLQAVVVAAAMDVTGTGIEATTVGVLFGANFVVAAASPVIAGVLVQVFRTEAAFVYSAGLLLAAVVVLLPLRLGRTPQASTDTQGA